MTMPQRQRRSACTLPLLAAVAWMCCSSWRPRLFVGVASEAAADELNESSKLYLAALTGAVEVAVCLLIYVLKQRTDKWQGANLRTLAPCLAVGWIIRFLLPIPAGVTAQAWSMLAIFVSMICAVVLGPLPPAGVTVCALAVAVFTGTVSFAEGLRAFTDEVVWLVLLAFFFAEGFQKTGLGDRIALTVIRAVGGTTLGVAYGLNFAELIVAAAMPCSAARAAAIFYPITQSVCRASGSDPDKKTESKCGKFLVECCYQATATSSCLFLTGAAQNYFVLKLAAGVGIDIPSPFTTWFMAAVGPSIVSFLLTPLIAFKLLPPEAKQTPDAPKAAKEQLDKMGPPSTDEILFGIVILGMVGMWATSSSIGIPPVVTALCGLALLMVLGVLTWDDCAKNKQGWGTYVSFASLVGLAAMLNNLGIVKWLASEVTAKITAAGLSGMSAFLVIMMAYWGVHYLFASQVAHVSALFQPFLLMLVKTGTPDIPAVFALAFASNLFATLTPYASAQSAVIFGGRYITAGEWYKAGFVFMVFYYVQWLVVGLAWWKLIGLI
eukprot:TRINITY_DN19666_c0_g1_i1.p1 TRINITY_DN19666_c0_g1~~TRINITY_DN19666_c0_g1_i1.p1  ORF type:complete len:551 (-),score=111.13 TRINITY_DN19666_c0_g1_i1:123-1775(-)